jgi:hypothetical protein
MRIQYIIEINSYKLCKVWKFFLITSTLRNLKNQCIK